MTVVLQSASGAQLSYRVNAPNETRASREALRLAEQERPAEGWRVLHVL